MNGDYGCSLRVRDSKLVGQAPQFPDPGFCRLEDMGVSKNRGTPKSSILIRFSIIDHPFWGTPIFGNAHMFSLGER